MDNVKRIIKIIFTLALVLVLLFSIASLAVISKPYEKIPVIGGYKPLNVLGASMEPAIKIGSVVIVKSIEPHQIKIGDIITYKPSMNLNSSNNNQTMVTHRVIKIYNENNSIAFETKGDANKTSDGNRITRNELIGKVGIAVPYAGKLGQFAKSRVGFLLFIILPGLAIIIIELFNIIKHFTIIKGQKSG